MERSPVASSRATSNDGGGGGPCGGDIYVLGPNVIGNLKYWSVPRSLHLPAEISGCLTEFVFDDSLYYMFGWAAVRFFRENNFFRFFVDSLIMSLKYYF